MLGVTQKKVKICSHKGIRPTAVKDSDKHALSQHITLFACISAKPSQNNSMKTMAIFPG